MMSASEEHAEDSATRTQELAHATLSDSLERFFSFTGAVPGLFMVQVSRRAASKLLHNVGGPMQCSKPTELVWRTTSSLAAAPLCPDCEWDDLELCLREDVKFVERGTGRSVFAFSSNEKVKQFKSAFKSLQKAKSSSKIEPLVKEMQDTKRSVFGSVISRFEEEARARILGPARDSLEAGYRDQVLKDIKLPAWGNTPDGELTRRALAEFKRSVEADLSRDVFYIAHTAKAGMLGNFTLRVFLEDAKVGKELYVLTPTLLATLLGTYAEPVDVSEPLVERPSPRLLEAIKALYGSGPAYATLEPTIAAARLL